MKNIREEQEKYRSGCNKNKTSLKILPLEEARKRRYCFNTKKPVKPNFLGIKVFKDFDLTQLIRYIDWSPFFHGWGLKGIYPSIFQKEGIGQEAKRLFKEANVMLQKITNNNLIKPKAVIGLFPANSKEDDIFIFKDCSREQVILKFPMLRQQQINDVNGYTLSLADFIASLDSGIEDYLGGFAATAGIGIEEYLLKYKENSDNYSSIMFRLIADRIVEATAEILHVSVRKEYWGYAPNENLSIKDILKGKFRGIRPAVGYPACPDHRIKRYLFDLMKVEENTGISLTDTYAMNPASSVSGFYFANNSARYFGIGKIGKDQVDDYAKRAELSVKDVEKLLYFAIQNYNTKSKH